MYIYIKHPFMKICVKFFFRSLLWSIYSNSFQSRRLASFFFTRIRMNQSISAIFFATKYKIECISHFRLILSIIRSYESMLSITILIRNRYWERYGLLVSKEEQSVSSIFSKCYRHLFLLNVGYANRFSCRTRGKSNNYNQRLTGYNLQLIA